MKDTLTSPDTILARFYGKLPKHHWMWSLATAIYMVLAFNSHILALVAQLNPPASSITNGLFMVSVFITLTIFIWLVVELPAHGKGRPWWIITLLFIAAASSHAREAWNILFDETMFRNIIETDPAEAGELVTWQWMLDVALFGMLPGLLLALVSLPGKPLRRLAWQKGAFLAGTIVLLLLSIFPFYDRYASLLRTHRHLRETVIPTAVLNSGYQYLRESLPQYEHPLVKTGRDAHLAGNLTHEKPVVMVMVVGETARAANVGLQGYARNTTPLLAQRLQADEGLVYFPQFFSCGTTTSISVPCMFSHLGRNDFDVDASKYTENLLDVFAHAGFDVVWIDNNSGCKGVCSRIAYEELRNLSADGCDQYGCNDMMLVTALQKHLATLQKNTLIVLHQKGSHGPHYIQRVPRDMQAFQPVCHSSQLQECTESEIINSYDNTILYTDAVLENIILALENAGDRINAAMLYASDHGESLGENNFYLHGLPWAIAPDEQKHVPALLWLSEAFRKTFTVDTECLHRQAGNTYSHDNIYPTLLGLNRIETATYNEKGNLAAPCQHENRQLALSHTKTVPVE